MIVVHDELDIDPGQLRVKFGGGDNGHNGLRSIRASLGTGDFYRVRVGVGRPPGDKTRPTPCSVTFLPVLGRNSRSISRRAADAVESLAAVGTGRTENVSTADRHRNWSKTTCVSAESLSSPATFESCPELCRSQPVASLRVTLTGLVDLFCTEPTIAETIR